MGLDMGYPTLVQLVQYGSSYFAHTCIIMQIQLEHEVGLEGSRLEAVALRSRCRQLESESLLADVFDKYEEEIQQLQVQHSCCTL